MSCPSWQRHKTGCSRWPVWTLPLLQDHHDAYAFWWRPCGVTWDAVPEPSWLLKLQWKPAFYKKVRYKAHPNLPAEMRPLHFQSADQWSALCEKDATEEVNRGPAKDLNNLKQFATAANSKAAPPISDDETLKPELLPVSCFSWMPVGCKP